MNYNKSITRAICIQPSTRLAQVQGIFDVEPTVTSELSWDINFTLPSKWNIGVIVGPSGSGKSTVARELFSHCITPEFQWPADRCILDGFPSQLGVREIVNLLSSVGFSSPPAWVRPFHVLSTGQQFRVNLARTLAEAQLDRQPRLVDEYSSVIDRTVARIGSAALAKTVRQRELQFIAVTCHYDVLDWLSPDWIFQPHVNEFTVTSREDLRPRPSIDLQIVRTHSSAWELFEPHHYLSSNLHKSAACYVGIVNDQPACFTAVLPFPHPTKSGYREHRTVCLPDFQGVGIGNAMSEYIASLYVATGKPYTSTTSHPAMISHRAKSACWRMTRKPSLVSGHSAKLSTMRAAGSRNRLTAGFAYIGPPRRVDAQRFGIPGVLHRQAADAGL